MEAAKAQMTNNDLYAIKEAKRQRTKQVQIAPYHQ
jgi:hypothetical protein